MQLLEVSGAVRVIYGSLGVKGLKVSPEKSQILSCDNVVANERYVLRVKKTFLSKWTYNWSYVYMY